MDSPKNNKHLKGIDISRYKIGRYHSASLQETASEQTSGEFLLKVNKDTEL